MSAALTAKIGEALGRIGDDPGNAFEVYSEGAETEQKEKTSRRSRFRPSLAPVLGLGKRSSTASWSPAPTDGQGWRC